MVPNMLFTVAMVRIGRVYDNWMIGVSLTNQKLQARGLRILVEASGATVEEATRALRQSGHTMDVALIMLKKGLDPRGGKAPAGPIRRQCPQRSRSKETWFRRLKQKHMDKLLIEGGRLLEGSIRISGAKNSAPARDGRGVADLRPRRNSIIFRACVTLSPWDAYWRTLVSAIVEAPATSSHGHDHPGRHGNQWRGGSVRTGAHHVRVDSYAGAARGAHGCRAGIGFPRLLDWRAPVDPHLKALEQMGAEISHFARIRGGSCREDRRLRGGTRGLRQNHGYGYRKYFDGPRRWPKAKLSSSMRRCEPEITDLAELLNKMGADIEGAGTSTIRVRGKEEAPRRETRDHPPPHRGFGRHSWSQALAITKGAASNLPAAPRST